MDSSKPEGERKKGREEPILMQVSLGQDPVGRKTTRAAQSI